jgi:predicted tellurium resistance membrane protein TerC
MWGSWQIQIGRPHLIPYQLNKECIMGVLYKPTVNRYLEKLEERYSALIKVMEGREPPKDFAHMNEDPDKFVKENVIVNHLDLTLAVDDVITILKEIRKLK